jgi:hypothetical protein
MKPFTPAQQEWLIQCFAEGKTLGEIRSGFEATFDCNVSPRELVEFKRSHQNDIAQVTAEETEMAEEALSPEGLLRLSHRLLSKALPNEEEDVKRLAELVALLRFAKECYETIEQKRRAKEEEAQKLEEELKKIADELQSNPLFATAIQYLTVGGNPDAPKQTNEP